MMQNGQSSCPDATTPTPSPTCSCTKKASENLQIPPFIIPVGQKPVGTMKLVDNEFFGALKYVARITAFNHLQKIMLEPINKCKLQRTRHF